MEQVRAAPPIARNFWPDIELPAYSMLWWDCADLSPLQVHKATNLQISDQLYYDSEEGYTTEGPLQYHKWPPEQGRATSPW